MNHTNSTSAIANPRRHHQTVIARLVSLPCALLGGGGILAKADRLQHYGRFSMIL
jgi:hypothetical protein